jgi:hypothetical protein
MSHPSPTDAEVADKHHGIRSAKPIPHPGSLNQNVQPPSQPPSALKILFQTVPFQDAQKKSLT